jgi:glycosyltransferase involved in cell wall biosynthesis
MPYSIAIDARKLQDFGIGTYVRHLLHGLAEIDDENQYVLFVKRRDRDAVAGLPDNFTPVIESSPVYSVRELLTLAWRLHRLKVDLYHATHYVLPAWVPAKVVVSIHDIIHLLYPDFLPSRFAFLYAQQMIRRSLTRSSRVITGSENTRLDLTQHFDVRPDKIEVIYHGVAESFRESLDHDTIDRWKRDLGLPNRYVLFVGNPTKPHKNLDRVVQAYAKALHEKPFDAPLVCVGDRRSGAFKFEQRAQHLGISDKVILLGHVADEALPAIYQGATLFLYPTLYEGFGLPVAEAMASGVPVVTSNNSALAEIARGHADLVNPLDIDEIAAAIVHCMTDEDHRRALAKLGLRRASQFRWEKAAQATRDVYMSVLEARPGTAWPRRLFRRSTGRSATSR